MRAVFLDRDSLDRSDLDFSPAEAHVDRLEYHAQTAPAQVAERIRGFDIVIVNKVPIEREALEQARPKLICVVATGVNNIDLAACRELSTPIANCRGYGTDTVAQHTLSLMLALATGLLSYHSAVRAGAWQQSTQFCLLDYPIIELAGKTLGIVGLGTLGGRVAQLGEALSMNVLIAQRPGGPAQADRLPLSELLPRVDVLSLHCPLTESTRNLIGAAELALMKPTAFLINTARGGLVDEQALVQALRGGRLGGAGFDVLTQEPPRAGNPLLAPDVPNLILTPHSAWGAREARQRIITQLAENIQAWRAGNPIRLV
jgi:glycerate dehydrogenase